MPKKTNIPGGKGTQPIGQLKREVKGDWNKVKTQQAFAALSDAQQREVLRRFMVYILSK